MKINETEIYKPSSDKPGYVRKIEQRTASEVFDKFKARLEEAELLPDEYFLMANEMTRLRDIFPNFVNICCYTSLDRSSGMIFRIEWKK